MKRREKREGVYYLAAIDEHERVGGFDDYSDLRGWLFPDLERDLAVLFGEGSLVQLCGADVHDGQHLLDNQSFASSGDIHDGRLLERERKRGKGKGGRRNRDRGRER
jgi:hypothetical protein